ncbi:CHAT domain-containing protein [Streptomyces sp. NPDC087420]|uniref:CHAT domain-containing protein n=1 Tax=Streptomyces sp. NPDC087420 TaxID=3365785 RepID=UPI00383324F7
MAIGEGSGGQVNDDGNGGLEGLRTWVTEATERSARLLPRDGEPRPHAREYDSSVAELDQLQALLAHDDRLRGKVTVRLGVMLTLRYLAEGGAVPGDRERAQRLLRESRDPETGAATDPRDRSMAGAFLATLLLPLPEMGAGFGQQPSFEALLNWQAAHGTAGAQDMAREMGTLLPEMKDLPLPLPPDLLEKITQLSRAFEVIDGIDGPAGVERLAGALPEGFPYLDELRTLGRLLPDEPPTPGVADLPGQGAEAGLPDATAQDGKARAGKAQDGEAQDGKDREGKAQDGKARDGSPADDESRGKGDRDTGYDLAGQVFLPALFGSLRALRGSDPDALNETLGRLSDALDRMPPGHELTGVVKGALGGLLHMGRYAGGNIEDQRLGAEFTRLVSDRSGEFYPFPGPRGSGGDGVSISGRAFLLMSRVSRAEESGDPGEVDAVIAELTALDGEPSREPEAHFMIPMVLAQAYMARGRFTDRRAMQLKALEYNERAAAAREHAVPILSEMFDMLETANRSLRAALTSDPGPLQGDLVSAPDASAHARWGTALSLVTRYDVGKDPADLDRAIEELEEIRALIEAGDKSYFAADALWKLADLYSVRRARRSAEDQAAAIGAAMAGLRTLAADVILQLGSEHGLLAARTGAGRGLVAAAWAASRAQVPEAVAALELGRALVLQAASATAAVPELLEGLGHRTLADSWRTSTARRPVQLDALPGELPSTLRRQALEALDYRRRALFATPTVSDLQAGLADSDADALVYLVPGADDGPGTAVIVGPDTGTGVLQLPLLSRAGSGPLDRYLEAAAERSLHPRDPAADRAWEAALSDLCDWAYPAVVGHVITGVAQKLAANEHRRRDRPGPPRIVLVPCGRLGVVPWHAARLPEGARRAYACQMMIISYAASGGQFLAASRRARRPPGDTPVLVADPRQDLTRAEQEVLALHESYYPKARLYGEFYDEPARREAAGTPEELLGVLGEPLSLLHVASHGSAGLRPTVSSLHLAFPDGTEELPVAEGGSGATPDLGMLTVNRLLDRDREEREKADDGGPLVVLSACETDLSTGDHDEALTLTTAFVAGGARDVVGSRWTTEDGASALMMAVFHHHVAVEGRSPADALREAQMWMLDPGRQDPGTLSPALLREMRRPGLDRLSVWAAFIHQGHPGPAKEAR